MSLKTVYRIIFACSFLLYFACITWLGTNGPIGHRGFLFIAVYVLACLTLLATWYFWPLYRRGVLLILFASVLARMLMLSFPFSDDMNRYVWEGKIQTYGYNPYKTAPNAPQLEPLRDLYWEGMNHKHVRAIYPPFTQLLFRVCAHILPDPHLFRYIFVLADLAIVFMLFVAVTAFQMSYKHILLYALNPLVLLYIAGEGHLDSLYLFFLVAAGIARKKGKDGRAFFLLGTAVMFNPIPVVFLPFMITRGNVKKVPLFFIPFLSIVPYGTADWHFFSVPILFASKFFYNGLLFSVYSWFVSAQAASILCWISFSILLLLVFFLTPDLFRRLFLVAGCFLVCTPIIHQRYLLLIVPFLVFFRSSPWIVLMVTVSASFFTRITHVQTGEWIDYGLAYWVEYVPFLAVGLLGILRGYRPGPHQFAKVDSVSVIIPTLNEVDTVELCIQSVKKQSFADIELIVVDGGSNDGTASKLQAMPDIKLLHSKPGRGAQITAGVEVAAGDVVLILHADSRLLPRSITEMVFQLRSTPAAIGGVFQASYDDPSRKYRFIALLNNIRALFSGISFGDQGQFFRRAELKPSYPAYHLMEDVELSFRLKEAGSLLFIRRGIVNPTRRWHQKGYTGNMFKVIWLTSLYILKRRFGLIKDNCENFYQCYCSTK